MKQFILAFILTFNSVAWAKCPDDIQVIEKDQVANCSGLLFSPEASENVDQTQKDLEIEQKLNGLLTRKNVLLELHSETVEKRLHLYMDRSSILAKQLYEREKDSKWEKTLYFGLGVLATGIAVYGASRLND